MALPSDNADFAEILVVEAAAGKRPQKRLPQWEHFEDLGYTINTGHQAAQCNACKVMEGISKVVPGTKEAMDNHLSSCPHVSKPEKQKADARIAAYREAAAGRRTAGKRKRSDSSSSAQQGSTSAHTQQKLSVPFKPLSAAEKPQFEQLLLDAVVGTHNPVSCHASCLLCRGLCWSSWCRFALCRTPAVCFRVRN